MPEVIEIKKYTDFIKKKIGSSKLINIKILKGRYKTHGPFENYKKLNKMLPLPILEVKNKGKFMYIKITDDVSISITLGLTGGWLFKKNGQLKYEHVNFTGRFDPNTVNNYFQRALNNLNVAFEYSNGILYYYDQLSFGNIKIYESLDELEKKLNIIGIDIMAPETTFNEFIEKIKKKNNLDKAIGLVLLNQKIVSGVGNYIRADVLWLSKISPFRKTIDLTDKEIKKLFINLRLLIWSSYDYHKGVKLGVIAEGLTLPILDYNKEFLIYNRQTDIYNNNIVKEKLLDTVSTNSNSNRYIYWVPAHQK